MEYKCPQEGCNKIFSNKKKLADHERRVHVGYLGVKPPAKKDELSTNHQQSKAKTTPKTLELKVEAKETPEKKETPEAKRYHCVDCGYSELTHGQTPCPKCGATLDWSQA